jgi:hypothetical protein
MQTVGMIGVGVQIRAANRSCLREPARLQQCQRRIVQGRIVQGRIVQGRLVQGRIVQGRIVHVSGG